MQLRVERERERDRAAAAAAAHPFATWNATNSKAYCIIERDSIR